MKYNKLKNLNSKNKQSKTYKSINHACNKRYWHHKKKLRDSRDIVSMTFTENPQIQNGKCKVKW